MYYVYRFLGNVVHAAHYPFYWLGIFPPCFFLLEKATALHAHAGYLSDPRFARKVTSDLIARAVHPDCKKLWRKIQKAHA